MDFRNVVLLGLVVGLGVLEDLFSIPVFFRLLMQMGIGLGMVFWGQRFVTDLGEVFFVWDGSLTYFSVSFTVFSVMGAMNAMNLFDGLILSRSVHQRNLWRGAG